MLHFIQDLNVQNYKNPNLYNFPCNLEGEIDFFGPVSLVTGFLTSWKCRDA